MASPSGKASPSRASGNVRLKSSIFIHSTDPDRFWKVVRFSFSALAAKQADHSLIIMKRRSLPYPAASEQTSHITMYHSQIIPYHSCQLFSRKWNLGGASGKKTPRVAKAMGSWHRSDCGGSKAANCKASESRVSATIRTWNGTRWKTNWRSSCKAASDVWTSVSCKGPRIARAAKSSYGTHTELSWELSKVNDRLALSYRSLLWWPILQCSWYMT